MDYDTYLVTYGNLTKLKVSLMNPSQLAVQADLDGCEATAQAVYDGYMNAEIELLDNTVPEPLDIYENLSAILLDIRNLA